MANYAFETKAIHGGSFKDGQTGSTVTPIYQTAAFSYDSAKELEDVFHKRKPGYIYSRISNPTVLSFESVFSSITNALGSIAVNSGESAIQLLFNVMLEPGDHVVASQSLFAGTNYLFDELC